MIPPSRVVVLTRAGCHRDDQAEATGAAVCEEMGVSWQAIDVDIDEALRARFNEHMPVTFLGQQLLSYRVFEGQPLWTALTAAPRPMSGERIVSLADQP